MNNTGVTLKSFYSILHNRFESIEGTRISVRKKGVDHVVINGKLKKIKRDPTFYEILRAIELDSKIAGHFAPTELKHEGSLSNPSLAVGRAI